MDQEKDFVAEPVLRSAKPTPNFLTPTSLLRLPGWSASWVGAVLGLACFGLGQQAQGQDTLVNIVLNATKQYANPMAATAAGYSPVLGCVSGSDHGAMGIHYVNANLLNGPIDPTKPQALIYEPQSNGQYQLVGVEFIILATALPANSAPEVDGQLMNYIDAPNRYGIPVPFFELHVWAWRENPQGPFVDWNDHVTCANHKQLAYTIEFETTRYNIGGNMNQETDFVAGPVVLSAHPTHRAR